MFKMFFNVVKETEKVIPKETKVKKEESIKVDVITEKENPSSKKVYAYVGKKNVGVYDSITLCASTLGLSRPMVKKAIESGVILDNGFKLTFTNK